jgi:predicted RecB family nuclease
VRNGLVVGTERYGLKHLEPLFRGKRDGDVTDAVASLVEFDRFRATGDRRILTALEAYNRDDVESTWLLYRWLLGLKEDS